MLKRIDRETPPFILPLAGRSSVPLIDGLWKAMKAKLKKVQALQ